MCLTQTFKSILKSFEINLWLAWIWGESFTTHLVERASVSYDGSSVSDGWWFLLGVSLIGWDLHPIWGWTVFFFWGGGLQCPSNVKNVHPIFCAHTFLFLLLFVPSDMCSHETEF